MGTAVGGKHTPLLFGSLRGYKTSRLRPDLVAGLTVWAVLVPESLAYATIAGVPPVVGLYAAVPALVFYAAFGSSRHLVVSPMSATAALSVSTVAGFAKAGTDNFVQLTAALAVVTGSWSPRPSGFSSSATPIGASMLLLLDRSSRPHIATLARESTGAWVDVARHPDLTPNPAVPVLRVESGLYFDDAHDVHETIRAAIGPKTRAVVIDAETAPFIDITATDMLAQAASELERTHVRLAIAHPIGQIRDVLRSSADESGTTIGVYPTIDEAVETLAGRGGQAPSQ